jgi:polar amino acid transport system substrate-binding protein
MKQLTQNFKTGELKIEDLPVPSLQEGFVLVENFFSLISSGTERVTVEIAKSSLLDKAKKRPDLVRQVFDNLRKEGVFKTLEKVKNKLEMPKALGYSSCGIVIQSKDFENKFKQNDRVACAGQDYASHAEIVSVPQNLTVKIPDNVSFEEASFTTIGAITLQGVRQLEPRIGEKVCVIGLGLIGQIVFQILKANGCSVFGIDISDFAVDLAEKIGIDGVANRNDHNLHNLVDAFTGGYGFDKAIITASSELNDPLVLSTEILRKKGLMVIVGDVKIDVPREPHFYKKELELRMATSYGPGRYDVLYEEAGIDYPYAYVRFTENRNMEVFLELVSKGRVNLKGLISHIFDFENALEAYDIILGKRKENFSAILLRYKQQKQKLAYLSVINKNSQKEINIGFIGAGSFAQNYLLPPLAKSDVSLEAVVTTRGITAKKVAEKFGFNVASTEPNDIINNQKIDTVFILTRHNTHAKYVCEALKNKKNIFVEKPLCLNIDELRSVISVYKGESILMVGFNRRFAPMSRLIKKELAQFNTPLVMNFRINAGYIPNEHWIQRFDLGGGRIIGEVCHFIDLMIYFANSAPRKIYASSVRVNSSKWRNDDNIAVNIEFDNGSLGGIVYSAFGDKAMEKERLEILVGGNSYVIGDFNECIFYLNGRVKKIKNRGKGHKEELESFIDAIKNGKENPISFESVVYTTLATFKIIESIRNNQPVGIDISELY